MATQSEENYLKNVYLLLEKNGNKPVATNALADVLATKPASVTDMLQKLAAKRLLHYKKYQGALLTQSGKAKAIAIIRKHRLWEYFLVEKLRFQWDQVHDVADELEHVDSDLLIGKLDAFLNFPKFDPHGDAIPDLNGKIASRNFKNLTALALNEKGKVAAVLEQQPAFLRHLDKLHIHMGTALKVTDRVDFDKSMGIMINDNIAASLSYEVAKNILVSK